MGTTCAEVVDVSRADADLSLAEPGVERAAMLLLPELALHP
jgi:hypothetical protein